MKCTKIQSVWKYAIMGICLLAVIITSMACQQKPREQNLRLEDYFQAASSQMMPPENPISNVNTVLFSPHGDLPPIVDAAPTHGEALMNDHLAQEVAKEENKDRYFSVTIDIIYFDFIEKYLKDAHEEYMTLCSDPAILKYESEYKLWLDTIYQPTTEDISMIEEKGDTDVLRP